MCAKRCWPWVLALLPVLGCGRAEPDAGRAALLDDDGMALLGGPLHEAPKTAPVTIGETHFHFFVDAIDFRVVDLSVPGRPVELWVDFFVGPRQLDLLAPGDNEVLVNNYLPYPGRIEKVRVRYRVEGGLVVKGMPLPVSCVGCDEDRVLFLEPSGDPFFEPYTDFTLRTIVYVGDSLLRPRADQWGWEFTPVLEANVIQGWRD